MIRGPGGVSTVLPQAVGDEPTGLFRMYSACALLRVKSQGYAFTTGNRGILVVESYTKDKGERRRSSQLD